MGLELRENIYSQICAHLPNVTAPFVVPLYKLYRSEISWGIFRSNSAIFLLGLKLDHSDHALVLMQKRYYRKEADGHAIWRRCKEVRRIGGIGSLRMADPINRESSRRVLEVEVGQVHLSFVSLVEQRQKSSICLKFG